jgi:hypothetical protein
VGFQKLDLNLIAYVIIKGVFFFPFPKVLGLYLLQPKNIRAYGVGSWIFIWILFGLN